MKCILKAIKCMHKVKRGFGTYKSLGIFQNVASKIGKKSQVFIISKKVIQGKILQLTSNKW